MERTQNSAKTLKTAARSQRGFTFIELLVSIVMIAVLAGLSLVGYASYKKRGYDNLAETSVHDIRGALAAGKISEEIEAGHFMGFSNGTGELLGMNVDQYVPGLVLANDVMAMVRYDGWCAVNAKRFCRTPQCCMAEWVQVRHCKGSKALNVMVWEDGSTTRVEMPNWACM